MSISYRGIRTERQWRAATGLKEEQFHELSLLFSHAYESFFETSIEEQVKERSEDPKFKTYQDFLFFTLYSLKSGLTYDLLGLSFDLSSSEAFEKQASGVRLLQMTLQQNAHLPRRQYDSLAQIKADLKDYDELIIDGSEQRRQRPVYQEDQQDDYSGKKKAHTIKYTVIAEPNRRILYVSPPYCGSQHDYSMLKSEFDPEKGDWFADKKIWIDLGYLGFEKEYEAKQIHIPHKRPRRKHKKDPKIEFTQKQKIYNKEVSKKRIFVEHSIGGLKRYRFLSDRLRCRNADFYSVVLGVCAGLWNFQLTC